MHPRIGLVTGTHRSGSTWVGETISSLCNCAYIWEPFNINSPSFYKAFFAPSLVSATDWYQYYSTSDPIWLELKKIFIQKYGHLIASSSLLLVNEPPKRFLKYLFRLASVQANLLTKNYFLVKDPLMLFSAESALLSSFVDNVIVVTRDPRAFYTSLIKANWQFDFCSLLPISSLPHIQSYKHLIRQYSRVKPALCPLIASQLWNILHEHILYLSHKPNILVVKYEELCNDPIYHFPLIIKFLFDINIPPSQANSYFSSQFTDTLQEDVSGVQMVRRGNPALISNMWRSRIGIEEEKIIINSSFKLMQKFSYL